MLSTLVKCVKKNMSNSLPLPHGNMPTVGYGLWKVGKDKASSLVKSVIGSGYRHVDSAANYGNEKEVNKDQLNKYQDLLSQGWRRYC